MNQIIYKNKTFSPDDIDSGSVHIASSLPSSSLEVNTMTVVLKNTGGIFRNFNRNDPIQWVYNGGAPVIFYVQTVDRMGPDLWSVYCTSAVGMLSEGRHYGGIYEGVKAADLIADICKGIPYALQEKYREVPLYGWLPIAAPRDNLIQVLFVLGAWIRTDADGVIQITNLPDEISGTIDADVLLEGAKAPEASKITSVTLVEHQFIAEGDSKKLFDGTALEGDVITFSEPMYNLSASGFTILESGPNYAKLGPGTGILTGNAYIHNTRDITRTVTPASVPNVKTIKNATLVSLVNSADVADRLVNYYKCTNTIESPVVYQGEQTGDVLSVYHPYDKEMVSACLASADITMSRLLVAQEKLLVGFLPPQYVGSAIQQVRQVITSNTTFTVPEGVTSIRVVLIGGGDGGAPGGAGSNGKSGTRFTYTSSVSGSSSYWITLGYGGAGGMGGSGGNPGRVHQVDISVTPGQTFSVSIGVGGRSGGSGGNTTFGSYSSASGTVLPSGYRDPVTNETFASKGSTGYSGGSGNGWAGGSATRDNARSIQTGTSVGNYGPGSNDTSSKSYPAYGTKDVIAYYIMSGGGARNANGSISGGVLNAGPSNQNYGTGQCRGGNGASATYVPSKPSTMGNGGMGGSGGGGGGGACAVECRYSNFGTPQGGSGGSGSAGGQGANGGIILYYSQKVPLSE